MPFRGFEGQAGTGKTHHLIEEVTTWVGQNPIKPHQQILALTFMHGSRRRLDQRLSTIPPLRRRYICMTIDSLAEQLTGRWKTLCNHHNMQLQTFEEIVDCAAQLLEMPVVVRWVAATYPVVIVDEGQDLTPARLRFVKALAANVKFFIAADEFQCLDDGIDTEPFVQWFSTGQITQLQQVRRTGQQGLLNAAAALRSGMPPTDGTGLKILYKFKNQAPFSIGHELCRGLGAGGDVAMLVAPAAKPWADQLLPRLTQGFNSATQVVPPIRIGWETRPDDEVVRVLTGFAEGTDIPYETVVVLLQGVQDPPPWLASVLSAVEHQRRACGQVAWTKSRLKAVVERRAALHRAYSYSRPRGIPVMSIHGAKNRQFRHVVVLWSPGVPGNADQQRRLLYNAITRAEQSCRVFVRTQALLNSPPFA